MRDREDPPRLHYVLDEAVIRRHVGGQRDPGIMRRQLEYLLEVAEYPNVTIELIPFTKGSHFGLRGEFTVLSFDSTLEDILYLESARLRGGDRTDTDSSLVAMYFDGFEHIRQLALSEEKSAAFIRRVCDEMGDDSANVA